MVPQNDSSQPSSGNDFFLISKFIIIFSIYINLKNHSGWDYQIPQCDHQTMWQRKMDDFYFLSLPNDSATKHNFFKM